MTTTTTEFPRLPLGRLEARFPVQLSALHNVMSLPAAGEEWSGPNDGEFTYGMLGNDQAGDCTFAGFVHLVQAICLLLGVTPPDPTAPAVLQAYFLFTHGQDSGAVEATVLHALYVTGILGIKVAGYARGVKGLPEMLAIVQTFGASYLGVMVPAPMQQQFWAYIQGTGGPIDLTGTSADNTIEGGHCLTPDARVLTRSFEWVPIGDLQAGDEIVGFEEHHRGAGSGRRFQVGTVESTKRLRLPCYAMTFEDGTAVTCAYDHLWLTGHGSGALHWTKAEDMRPLGPSGNYGARVAKPLDAWETDSSWGAGYLAAAFDGEGWIDTNGEHHFRIGFTQRDNAMLETVRLELKERGFIFAETRHHGGFANSTLASLGIGRTREVARFLGSVRPQRLLHNARPEGMGSLKGRHVRLVRREFVGEHEVVALQTDCHTYVAEGLASHNCIDGIAFNQNHEVVTVLTWGKRVPVTFRWLDRYLDEHWAIIPQQVRDRGELDNVNWALLDAELRSLGSPVG